MPLAEDLRLGPGPLGHAARPPACLSAGAVGPAAGLAWISRLDFLHPRGDSAGYWCLVPAPVKTV